MTLSDPLQLDHAVVRRVDDLLYGSMGALPTLPATVDRLIGRLRVVSPWLIGFAVGLVSAAFFCLLPRCLFATPDHYLLWLSVFGSTYFGFAVAMASVTSRAAVETIGERIVPLLLPSTLERILAELDQRFASARLNATALVAGLASTAAAMLALWRDLPKIDPAQLGLSSIGMFVLFFTAARVIDAARFYRAFSRHLLAGGEPLYPPLPASSALIRAQARLGRGIMLFWLAIFVSIATMPLFMAMARGDGYLPELAGLRDVARLAFVRVVMLITMSFSGVFATGVFLANEATLRRAVDRGVYRCVVETERAVRRLLASGAALDAERGGQLDRLIVMRAELLKSGRYRSFASSGISLLIPLLGPIVALATKLLPGK